MFLDNLGWRNWQQEPDLVIPEDSEEESSATETLVDKTGNASSTAIAV